MEISFFLFSYSVAILTPVLLFIALKLHIFAVGVYFFLNQGSDPDIIQ